MDRVVVVTVDPPEDALTIAADIERSQGLGADAVRCLVPGGEALGDGFWGEAGAQWWQSQGLDDADPVLVACHRPGLARVLRDVASRWLVWCPTPDAAKTYAGVPRVGAVVAEKADQVSALLVAQLREWGWRFGERPTWGPFRPATAPPTTESHAVPELPRPAPSLPTAEPWPVTIAPPGVGPPPADVPPMPQLSWVTVAPAPAPAVDPVPEAPLFPAAATAVNEPDVETPVDLGERPALPALLAHAPRPSPGRRRGRARRLATLFRGGDGEGAADVGAIGQALAALHDTVILVGSRKGGVGKTTESLAVGFLTAQAVEVLGGSALVLDANLTNADISVKLRMPDAAPTVREAVAALMRNQLAPTPVAVRGSSLRVYAEGRETERYTPDEIDTLAQYIRRYYTAAVVDLPNAIPGCEERAESVVEAWLPHADVVVIPMDTSLASFEGAADMLAAITELKERQGGAFAPGIVLAFLRPADVDPRKIAPDLAATLRELEALGAEVVDIPASSRMAMVDWSDSATPLTDADPKVTRAYWKLVAAVVAARRAECDE